MEGDVALFHGAFLYKDRPENWQAISDAMQRPTARGNVVEYRKVVASGAVEQVARDTFSIQLYVDTDIV